MYYLFFPSFISQFPNFLLYFISLYMGSMYITVHTVEACNKDHYYYYYYNVTILRISPHTPNSYAHPSPSSIPSVTFPIPPPVLSPIISPLVLIPLFFLIPSYSPPIYPPPRDPSILPPFNPPVHTHILGAPDRRHPVSAAKAPPSSPQTPLSPCYYVAMHGPSPPRACWPSPRSSSSSPSRHQRGSWTLSRRKTSSYTRASGKSAGTGSTPKRSNVASMIPCPVRYVKPIMTSSNGNISASLSPS